MGRALSFCFLIIFFWVTDCMCACWIIVLNFMGIALSPYFVAYHALFRVLSVKRSLAPLLNWARYMCCGVHRKRLVSHCIRPKIHCLPRSKPLVSRHQPSLSIPALALLVPALRLTLGVGRMEARFLSGDAWISLETVNFETNTTLLSWFFNMFYVSAAHCIPRYASYLSL